MDEHIFREGIKMLEIAFRTPLSQQERNMYFKYLKNHDAEHWEKAVDGLIKETHRFPTIAACIETLNRQKQQTWLGDLPKVSLWKDT